MGSTVKTWKVVTPEQEKSRPDKGEGVKYDYEQVFWKFLFLIDSISVTV